jgi:hypothetical protein
LKIRQVLSEGVEEEQGEKLWSMRKWGLVEFRVNAQTTREKSRK